MAMTRTMTGRRGGILIAFLAAFVVAELAFIGVPVDAAAQQRSTSLPQPAPAITCGGAEIARGHVSRVLDGRDFVLDDGRTVHLAAIEVPLSPRPETLPAAPGGAASKAALAKLLNGAPVVLRQAELPSDRYGRIVAYVDVLRADARRSAEAEMIAAGFARLGDEVGSQACATELLRREDSARKAKLGLWADPYYAPVPADEAAEILKRRAHFALVEGTVVSVHASGATLYVNFGRHWWQDFAATIRRRNERNFAAAGLDLQGLAGRQVLIRGWVEAHSKADNTGGSFWRAPWIEVAHAEQIELVDHSEARVTRQ